MTRKWSWVFLLMLVSAASASAAPQSSKVREACRGVRDAEDHVGLFTDARNIVRIEEIKREQPASEAETPDQRAGARIILIARPGMTAEWLQRVAECHIAWNNARGYQPLTPSPLDVRGAKVYVSSTGDGFAVDIVSLDWNAAREIVRRARILARPPTS